MRHLKCLACQTCLRSADSEADPVDDLCPVCGSLLEPVGDLGEIVGYRSPAPDVRRHRAPTAPPRVIQAFDDGVIGERRRQTKVRSSRWAASHAPT